MCGRFTFQPTEAFYERFEISKRLDSLVPRYNIAPGQMVPVIIANSPRQLERSAGVTLDVYPVSRMVNKPSLASHALIQKVE
jgi:putative SOS response-associated peptidase YedK